MGSDLVNPKAAKIKSIIATFLGLMLSGFVLAQNAPAPVVQRQVQGQTLISRELPAAQFTFSIDYRYMGGQVIALYGNAEAEQHLFVRGARLAPYRASIAYSLNTFSQPIR